MTNFTNTLWKILSHPLTKRLAVATPIALGGGLLRAWFGEHSPLVGLLVGIGSFLFADWLFSTKSEREKRRQLATAFFREHWMVATKWCMYVLVCVYLLESRSEPAEPVVQQVFSLVQMFGLFAVLIAPAITSTNITAVWGSGASVACLATRFLNGLTVYSMALWLIGQSGDALYKWAIAHPTDASIGAAAFTIVWMIVRFSGGSSLGSEIIARSAGTGRVMTASGSVKPTVRDNCYTAAHEAGHTLVYAALGEELPVDVKLAINDHSDEQGILGFVTGISSNHQLDEKPFVEWCMLVFLAGKMGESVMHGESTLGSVNDHVRWLDVARSYLANHYRGMYYADPKNKFEQEQNETKLEALQAEQLAMLQALFDANIVVFRELVCTLLATRTMGRDDLIPFLSRVKLPDGFPLPFGPFGILATE